MTVGQRALRRAGAFLLLAACAQMDPPPGGPEDRTPPYLVSQAPDSLAVVPGWNDPVVIRFSERISEQQVEQSVMVSPRTSPVLVDRGSREIRVSLRRGWEPGQIYQVLVRPVVQDLFNNTLREPVEVIFSTGPEIPDTRLVGVVRDRITGEPEADARVEAIRAPDSLVYAVPSDSTGRFRFAHLPTGEYLIRAFPDQNRNREIDPFEPRDSLPATVLGVDTAEVVLSIVLPDSTAPIIASAQAGPDRRVELRFDDYLDPTQSIVPEAVTITGADGVAIPVATVTLGEPLVGEQDTTEVTEPVLPSQLVVVELAEGVELVPEAEYTVAVTGIRNVVGREGASQEEFTAPVPPAPPEGPLAPGEEPDTVPPEPDAPAL